MDDEKDGTFDPRRYFYLSHRPLVLYGAGAVGDFFSAYLGTLGIGVNAFCDADPLKRGKVFHDVEIISPEELPLRFPSANIVVSVNPRATSAIVDRLMGLGTARERIFTDWRRFVNYSRPIRGFSVDMHADLYRFRHRLEDGESRRLFLLRYRHWLLRDRPDNDGEEGALPGGVRRREDVEDVCDRLDEYGAEALEGDRAFEFANDDALLPPRLFFAAFHYRPENRLYLRPGSDARRTCFVLLGKDSPHAV